MAVVNSVVIDEAILRSRGESVACTCTVIETVIFPGRGASDLSMQNVSETTERREQSRSSNEQGSDGLCSSRKFLVTEVLLRLLLRLSHGGIRIGILLHGSAPDDTAALFTAFTAALSSHPSASHLPSAITPISCSAATSSTISSPDASLADLISPLEFSPESTVLVTRQQCSSDEDFVRLHHLLQSGASQPNEAMPGSLPSTELLPSAISHFNCKASRSPLIGYAMKWSRELDFLKRSAFPLHPRSTSPSPLFSPILLNLPLEAQLADVTAILHKATDEVADFTATSADGVQLTFSESFQQLQRHCSSHSITLIDPLPAILPLTDRLSTLTLMQSLLMTSASDEQRQKGTVVRPPRFAAIDSWSSPASLSDISAAGLSPPLILKPRLACGPSLSHSMAIVFSLSALSSVTVPMPAIAQEYVDHGAVQFKCYVIGDQFFHAARASTPDAAPLTASHTLVAAPAGTGAAASTSVQSAHSEGQSPPASISFHSLKSLPKSFPEANVTASASARLSKISSSSSPPSPLRPEAATGAAVAEKPAEIVPCQLDSESVGRVACMLRERLGLTLFGFDVLIQQGTGDHVIVDVNYFPSFKDVPQEQAMPALWRALQQ